MFVDLKSIIQNDFFIGYKKLSKISFKKYRKLDFLKFLF